MSIQYSVPFNIATWVCMKNCEILQHLAYEYAKRGACLVLAARRERSLQEVAERARDLGAPDVVVVRADVSKVEDCRRIVDQTMNHFGRCKYLISWFCGFCL